MIRLVFDQRVETAVTFTTLELSDLSDQDREDLSEAAYKALIEDQGGRDLFTVIVNGIEHTGEIGEECFFGLEPEPEFIED